VSCPIVIFIGSTADFPTFLSKKGIMEVAISRAPVAKCPALISSTPV